MSETKTPRSRRSLLQLASLAAGPLVALAILLLADLDPARPAVTATAAVAAWMALWWITEAIPLAATALLPVVLFPLLGIQSGRDVAPTYFNHIIFLFLGGFVVALAIERWGLHRRIALRILMVFGTGSGGLLGGFMAAGAFLSMWISNTATTMMMVPIVMAVVAELEEGEEAAGRSKRGIHAIALLLGVAYASSIGGTATLVGTPPNPLFAQVYEISFPEAPEISFARWMLFALPLSLVMLALSWVYLRWTLLRAVPGRIDRSLLRGRLEALGPMSREEKSVAAVFLALALLWVTRVDLELGALTLQGWGDLLPHGGWLTDGSVAVAMALLLFVLPARAEGSKRLMDWRGAQRLPWGIVLLFGGGFALAAGFRESGLSAWVGERLAGASELPLFAVVFVICVVVTFLTELTSNTATAQILLPVLAALAVSMDVPPLLLMVPATISCSFAFMLPVATPPNAIVFGTERLRVLDMARVGLALNLIGALAITVVMWTLGRFVFGIAP